MGPQRCAIHLCTGDCVLTDSGDLRSSTESVSLRFELHMVDTAYAALEYLQQCVAPTLTRRGVQRPLFYLQTFLAQSWALFSSLAFTWSLPFAPPSSRLCFSSDIAAYVLPPESAPGRR